MFVVTPDERDRLVVVEIQQKEVLKKMEEIEKSLNEIKIRFATLGGIGLALTGMGMAIGWVLTQAKNFIGLAGG